MANSRSLQAYVDSVKRLYPGATVWTKGDAAHLRSASDHNDDDTPGSTPEQQDSDSLKERRAADIPLLGGVTMAKLDMLRARITDRPANRARSKYVILRQTIWRYNNGWKPEVYRGDYHNHLHNSIWAGDDNNAAPWDIFDAPTAPSQGQRDEGNDDDMKPILGKLTTAATVWKGYGLPGSLVAIRSERAYNDVKNLGATEFHYGGPHAGDATSLVDVVGTLPFVDDAEGVQETPEANYWRSVQAVNDAG